MNILQVLTHRIGSLIGIKNEHLTSLVRCSFFIPIKELFLSVKTFKMSILYIHSSFQLKNRSCVSKLVRCSFFIPIKEPIPGMKNEHLISFDTQERFSNWNKE
jgi:hypothetical protein